MNSWSYICYRFIFEDIPGHFYLTWLKILQGYIYLLYLFKYLFIIFIIFIYLFIYLFNSLFITKLYLLEVMLLDWIIKLKTSIIYVLLEIVNFQKILNVSDMEYFMCPLMFMVNLMFTTLLKNQVECIFLALLSCWHL